MTYKELYDKALWDLEHNNMTLGEFDRITEPLNKEIPNVEKTDGVIAELEKIKTEIQDLIDFEESCCGNITLGYGCLSVINNRISELKGENE